jgi:hypothetical protein
MPTKRHRRVHAIVAADDNLQAIHLELGDCLLAGPGKGCVCGLRRPDGTEDDVAIRAARKRLGIPETDAG